MAGGLAERRRGAAVAGVDVVLAKRVAELMKAREGIGPFEHLLGGILVDQGAADDFLAKGT